MPPAIQYLADASIDSRVDQEIRSLLTTCFTNPQDAIFKTQRFFKEPYPHRWIIRDNHAKLVAHIGVHEKTVSDGNRTYRIGGIAEVCVHPDHRGQGYVRLILKQVHEFLNQQNVEFAVLFGDDEVYGSSGYVRVVNLVHGSEEEGWQPANAMVCELSKAPWPKGPVQLPGPTF